MLILIILYFFFAANKLTKCVREGLVKARWGEVSWDMNASKLVSSNVCLQPCVWRDWHSSSTRRQDKMLQVVLQVLLFRFLGVFSIWFSYDNVLIKDKLWFEKLFIDFDLVFIFSSTASNKNTSRVDEATTTTTWICSVLCVSPRLILPDSRLQSSLHVNISSRFMAT